MSKTDSLHYQLCVEGAKWLRRRIPYELKEKRCKDKPCFGKKLCGTCRTQYHYVAVEICTYGTENPDVWGYDGYSTVIIEVKTSRADFLADRKKYWRTTDPEFQAGNDRLFLCPEGIIKEEDLPQGWGLLYWNGKDVYPVKEPTRNLATGHADMRILYSILRRENFKKGIFNYRGQNTTIKPQK